jgi:hypothetical protein
VNQAVRLAGEIMPSRRKKDKEKPLPFENQHLNSALFSTLHFN